MRKGAHEDIGTLHLQVGQLLQLVGNTGLVEHILPLGILFEGIDVVHQIFLFDFLVERRSQLHHLGQQLLGHLAGNLLGLLGLDQLQEDGAHIALETGLLTQRIDTVLHPGEERQPLAIDIHHNQGCTERTHLYLGRLLPIAVEQEEQLLLIETVQQVQQQGRNQQPHQVVGETVGIEGIAQRGVVLFASRVVGPHVHKQGSGLLFHPTFQRFQLGSVLLLLAQQRGQREVIERLVAAVALRSQCLVGPTGRRVTFPAVILGRRHGGRQLVGDPIGERIGRYHQVVVDAFALGILHPVEHVLYHVFIRHLHLVELVTAEPVLQFGNQHGQFAEGIFQTALGQQGVYLVLLFGNFGCNHRCKSKR